MGDAPWPGITGLYGAIIFMTALPTCYVYVLRSRKDGKLYTGLTADVHRRLEQHNAGQVTSTKTRRPLELIYYEAYVSKDDAEGRELFLKSGSGKRYLKKQLANYFGLHPLI